MNYLRAVFCLILIGSPSLGGAEAGPAIRSSLCMAPAEQGKFTLDLVHGSPTLPAILSVGHGPFKVVDANKVVVTNSGDVRLSTQHAALFDLYVLSDRKRRMVWAEQISYDTYKPALTAAIEELARADHTPGSIKRRLAEFTPKVDVMPVSEHIAACLEGASAEAAIGLAILVVFHRNRGTIDVEDVNVMKG